MVVCGGVPSSSDLLDHAYDGSNAINDQESFIVEIRSELSNAQSNGSEVRSMVLRIPLHNTILHSF
ncbi:hypothetical protein RHMOL_Rhmol07G0171000 [Rhododendron molle]|uniref:Uncharacterized protein n=1 Tax=Rhododendron molle TaxID=49168 RepID=A0ACC0N325_RHOML|nr:hypothetical protein RHMOL_Rhmol07G0171000 [Rhododendron molle]